jgi:hypothetical protein
MLSYSPGQLDTFDWKNRFICPGVFCRNRSCVSMSEYPILEMKNITKEFPG